MPTQLESTSANRIISLANGGSVEQPRMVLVFGAGRANIGMLQKEADAKGFVFVDTKANTESLWSNNLLAAAKANLDKTLVVSFQHIDRMSPKNQEKLDLLLTQKKVANVLSGQQVAIPNKVIILLTVDVKSGDWDSHHAAKNVKPQFITRSLQFELKS